MDYENRDSYIISFEQKETQLYLTDIKESRFSLSLQNLVQDYGLQHLVVLDQIHSSQGVCVEDTVVPGKSSWFEFQGDYLITNQKKIALVVLTADCVPLVLYDSKHKAIGVVHAGWKGSYAGIVQQVLQAMQQKYATQVDDIICTFGPSAKDCCYEVSLPFVQDFKKRYPQVAEFRQYEGKWYFNNSLFLQKLLKKFGIQAQNIYTSNALCTICNSNYCSFRKERESAGRQITMVALH